MMKAGVGAGVVDAVHGKIYIDWVGPNAGYSGVQNGYL
jgi:hypothetical protein